MFKKNLKLIFSLMFFLLLTSACSLPYLSRPKVEPIKDFAACAKQYPVMESYPRQCRVPDGTVFVEILTSEEKKKTEPLVACKNLCGDGNCQDIVCLSTECPCPETKASCPGDCSSAEQQIVGGDKDEHGCIGSAGYSWCAPKNKCLRVWEEVCPDTPIITELKKQFATKYNKQVADIKMVIEKENADHVRGGVNLTVEEGEGGIFLAVKVNNTWQIVYDGNGGINCNLKTKYGFPDEMLTDCYSE